jgi:mannosyltransferase
LDAFAFGPALPVAACALFLAVWIPRLLRSFWVDEAGSYWMAHEGLVRAVQKTWHWPGQSILYSAIASLFCFDGSPLRDTLLRLPSVVGLALAAYFVYRIGEKRIGKHAGLAAVILFVFHPSVIDLAPMARPYALAMAAVSASCWALDEWVASRSRKHLLYYVAASVLVIYLHYFFAVILGIQALYLLYVFLIEGRRQHFGAAIVAGMVVLVSVAPLIPHLRLLVNERHTLPFAPPPTRGDLAADLAPSVLIAGTLVAGCILLLIWPEQRRGMAQTDRPFLFLLSVWWLIGPLLFMAVSKVTTMRIFVPRYLAFSLPAQALLFAYLGYRLFGASGARVWALLSVVLFAANPLTAVRGAQGPDELLPVVRLVRAEANVPVFFPSLLQESLFYDWRAGNRPDSYLFAPLVAYPIENPLLPLPVTANR